MPISLNIFDISSIKLGNNNVSKIFLGGDLVFPPCLNSTSKVKMTGWVAGDRTLSPIGYAPWGRETYDYGDETVRYETGVWLYINDTYGELARAYSYAEWPWLVNWPSPYAAQKVCSFGSSGFQWMNISSVTSSTASGIGQNNITVSITQSNGGMEPNTGMYGASTFPEAYGVPVDGIQILNSQAGIFTAVFSEPVTDALVAFASVGQGGIPVPVQISAPFTPIWDTSTTYQNPVNGTQYSQFTGEEGFNIIRIDGTVSTVTFNYTVSEYYCTVCFGFVDQNV
jgi:hypothetical protein